MDETFSTHGREPHTRFWWENMKKVDDLGALSWVGVVVKQILKRTVVCGLDSLVVPVVVCCEDGNGPVQEHLDYLSCFQLTKQD